ncbi:MAG: macro domain-containing protein [Lachnospiraceae bacterium]|nr:macro domain-containing protein [Lachnospiraceae bacterium]
MIRRVENNPNLQDLSACYSNSLTCALEKGIRSIAFSSISTGVYGYIVLDIVGHSHGNGESF